jgi:hypothetical protein
MGSSPTDYTPDEPLTGFVVVRLMPALAAVTGESLSHAAEVEKLEALAAVLTDFGSPPSQRLVQSVSVEKILELEEKAAGSRLPPLFSLASFWRVDFRRQASRMEDFLGRLRDIAEVAEAYPDSAVGAPAVTPGNNPLFTDQKYLAAAPVGIDAPFAWLQHGGDGAGVSVVDLEQGWNFAHEDLAPRNPVLLWGDQEASDANQNHGTESLGVMVAADNAVGGIGIAPAASPVRTVSHFNAASGTRGHVADAVLQATLAMAVGDILVLEVETARASVTGWPDNHPIEIKDAEFAAIRLAVSQGFVVIEAAGNGGFDLDAYVSPQGSAQGKRVLNRNDPDFRESGAIMVSAGSAAAPHQRPYFANYGSRMDCYAWGEQVTTSGGAWFGEPPDRAYTNDFDGTSSATAILGGAAVVVQAVAQAATGQRLSPLRMQTMLSDPGTGTPSANPLSDRIGVMPDLRRILTHASLVPDVYLRDEIGDDGTVPALGAVGASPDIILVDHLVADPAAAFGQGSGLENRDDVGTMALADADNYLYLRIRNRGTPTASATTATVYWSEPATLVTPGDWSEIGTTAPIDVPQGDTLVVTPALQWPAAFVPAAGHYCFVAVLDSLQDPAPALPDPTDWQGYLDFIQNQNNVAWRNINVIRVPSLASGRQLAPLRFAIVGAPDNARLFDLEVIQQLPAGVSVGLTVPAALGAQLRPEGWRLEIEGKERLGRLAVPAAPRQWLTPVMLDGAARYPSALTLDLAPNVRLDGHSVTVRQLYQGIEVGRIAWRFADSPFKGERAA